MTRPLADLYPDWPQYAARLREAVADLDDRALALRAGPEHGPIWALAAHIAGSRAVLAVRRLRAARCRDARHSRDP